MNNLPAASNEIVSFGDEKLILVDENDNEIGNLSKDECHDGHGQLHRAFSLFIFNENGDVLLQQRSSQKRLWPMYWSNACCSHPRRGEDMPEAISRRLYQELGLTSELEFLFKFIYQAQYDEVGSEHELCWVYLGRSSDDIVVNANEIADWRFVSADRLDRELAEEPGKFTPWMKLEWLRIQQEHGNALHEFAAAPRET
ncbi:MAG: isopentenyl-diphosphate Delta-isomerase [Gammaproteobacteria bacterium]|nr:isopentenyl-diphosphate Delta-isomerase [Gammaproteobacteria bacterium]